MIKILQEIEAGEVFALHGKTEKRTINICLEKIDGGVKALRIKDNEKPYVDTLLFNEYSETKFDLFDFFKVSAWETIIFIISRLK